MKQDRFLIGILIGIGLLVVVALAVFFTRSDQASYFSEGTPDGVVHNYVLALLNKDYQKAYGYLADLDHKPTFSEFRQSFAIGRLNPDQPATQLGRTDVVGDTATVEISMVFSQGEPFGSPSRSLGSARLMKQGGAWKISSMPTYNLWDYGWYQAPPK